MHATTKIEEWKKQKRKERLKQTSSFSLFKHKGADSSVSNPMLRSL